MKFFITAIVLYIGLITGLVAEEIEFKGIDGTTIYGDYYAGNDDAPLIMLHHQAGWNARGEYGEISARLVDNGYNVLSVDARGGGNRDGVPNRTLEALGINRLPFCEVLPDVISTLKFANEKYPNSKKILWGSSYSAALVLKVAASEADDVLAVLSFSPAEGEFMGNCQPSDQAGKISVPVMILRPASELKSETNIAQFELFKSSGYTMHVAENGVHGSSMLVTDRTKHNTDAEWSAVLSFLEKVSK